MWEDVSRGELKGFFGSLMEVRIAMLEILVR
jgi:hypothetical protein